MTGTRLFIQNYSAITQVFYVTMRLSLKLLVHDLLCSEMLRFTELKSKSKNCGDHFTAQAALAQPAPISQHLPTPLALKLNTETAMFWRLYSLQNPTNSVLRSCSTSYAQIQQSSPASNESTHTAGSSLWNIAYWKSPTTMLAWWCHIQLDVFNYHKNYMDR